MTKSRGVVSFIIAAFSISLMLMLACDGIGKSDDSSDDESSDNDDDAADQPFTLCPTADATIDDNFTDYNGEGKDEDGKWLANYVGQMLCNGDCPHKYGRLYTLLAYDLSGAPESFSSATLSIRTIFEFVGYSFNVSYGIITEDWDSYKVTWDTKPSFQDSGYYQDWDTSGEMIFDATDLIRQAIDLGDDFKGFILGLDTDNPGVCYNSICYTSLIPTELGKENCPLITIE